MTPLTRRQRVLMALNHQEPDRVPLASFTMVDVSYHALRDTWAWSRRSRSILPGTATR